MSSTEKLSSRIYSGAAKFGKFATALGLGFAILVGVSLILIGAMMGMQGNRTKMKTKGTVMSTPECEKHKGNDKGNDNDSDYYSCDHVVIQYKVGDKVYHITRSTLANHNYKAGDEIDVHYDPKNPSDADIDKSIISYLYKFWFFVLLAGIIIIAGAYFWYWLARRYKVAAAALGIVDGVELLAAVV